MISPVRFGGIHLVEDPQVRDHRVVFKVRFDGPQDRKPYASFAQTEHEATLSMLDESLGDRATYFMAGLGLPARDGASELAFICDADTFTVHRESEPAQTLSSPNEYAQAWQLVQALPLAADAKKTLQNNVVYGILNGWQDRIRGGYI